MTPEELLIPRYRINEFGYPDMPFTTGAVIELREWATNPDQPYWVSPASSHWFEAYFDRYPNIFSKLPWWYGRSQEQLPRYVKSGNRLAVVYRWMEDNYSFLCDSIVPEQETEGWVPITETDFLKLMTK